MGYTTDFYGQVTVKPPLNDAERSYLERFSQTRRMSRKKGPYFVDGSGDFGQGDDADIVDYNSPPSGQPGLWCQWVPQEDGASIGWDGGEKFYDSAQWMQYIIDHFLKPGAHASRSGDPQFEDFTFDHVVNGQIEAQGEEPSDMWLLVVTNNVVSTKRGTVSYQ